jgi:hypothetical protein
MKLTLDKLSRLVVPKPCENGSRHFTALAPGGPLVKAP